ncbi:CAP domain-containing protein [Leptospira sp. severe_002]|uniref:CAP domain-containing protein n=1 Tax=Leptospira sp. severe_002 TaxID=2838237 RepID=UPI001E40908F|nr:CAP domain-containing protein [Leptospira sp. severe_002]
MRKALLMLPLLLAVSGCGSLSSIVGVGENATTLNSFRAANGLSQLSSDPGLTAMAAGHAADMARRESLDHNGFMEFRGPKGARAENVAYGCKDSACTIQQWIKSSGHRANMLRKDINKYGMASATSASGRRYWALEVGE